MVLGPAGRVPALCCQSVVNDTDAETETGLVVIARLAMEIIKAYHASLGLSILCIGGGSGLSQLEIILW